MATFTVSTLIVASHHGQRARVTTSDGQVREGVLSFAKNPSYFSTHHWWLIVESSCAHFKHDALSLQWAGGAVVELLDVPTVDPVPARS